MNTYLATIQMSDGTCGRVYITAESEADALATAAFLFSGHLSIAVELMPTE